MVGSVCLKSKVHRHSPSLHTVYMWIFRSAVFSHALGEGKYALGSPSLVYTLMNENNTCL